jgi:hypothetical protein
VLPFAYPLDEFYLQAGLPPPDIEQIDAAAMPEPYRSLLVHNDDMTPTLERFLGGALHLDVLSRSHRGDAYFREVLLRLQTTHRPVEFGAIKINLPLFPAAARHAILEEHWPLGHILGEFRVRHTCRPKAFLRVQADALIRGALALTTSATLYGRRNTLLAPQQAPLAEVIEILPPFDTPAAPGAATTA